MIVTNDSERAEKLRTLRDHGAKPKYYHRFVGGNFRLDAIQAAVISAKLPYLERWTAARQLNAKRYGALFQEAGLPITLPAVVAERHIFNQYVIRTPARDPLRAYLREHGIGTEVYYPLPLHLQECFSDLAYKPGAFPQSEKAAAETIALPVYPELTESQARFVVDTIAEFGRQNWLQQANRAEYPAARPLS